MKNRINCIVLCNLDPFVASHIASVTCRMVADYTSCCQYPFAIADTDRSTSCAERLDFLMMQAHHTIGVYLSPLIEFLFRTNRWDATPRMLWPRLKTTCPSLRNLPKWTVNTVCKRFRCVVRYSSKFYCVAATWFCEKTSQWRTTGIPWLR